MDIKLRDENNNFKFRVAGCLIVNNKILTVQICNCGFYSFPGGHVHIGEDTQSAVLREFKEETSLDCKIVKLLSCNENFFKSGENKFTHELGFYYLLEGDNISTEDFCVDENDEGVIKHLDFKWYDLDKLDNVDLRPLTIKQLLKEKIFDFKHIIFKQYI